MTWEIVLAALFLLSAAVAIGIWLYNDREHPAVIAAIGSCAVAVLLIAFGSFEIVGTREVGVVTTFGRPHGQLSNGFHFKAPWSKVTEMDGAIQIDTHTGDSAPLVRLANNATAKVDNSVQWRIKPQAVDELFLDYRNFDNIRENLVTRQLTKALNAVFGTFDPMDPKNVDGVDTVAMGNKVADSLRQAVGEQVEIINVMTPVINYQGGTQDRVNALNAERANTRVAEQKQLTAEAEATANERLSASVSHDPNVLVSKCLDAAKEAKLSPLGCWPNTAVVPTVPAK